MGMIGILDFYPHFFAVSSNNLNIHYSCGFKSEELFWKFAYELNEAMAKFYIFIAISWISFSTYFIY